MAHRALPFPWSRDEVVVSVQGNPPPQFTWTLDGFPIPDGPRFLVGQYVTVQDDVISHVNVSNIKSEDGGEYTCTAHNSVGKISHSARVNVYGLPFIREMPRIIGVAGTSLVIKCPVAGYPIETITWEREGQMLPVNRRQRVYTNGTLVIEQTQRTEDAGTYTCQAQNRQRHSARRDLEVQINGKSLEKEPEGSEPGSSFSSPEDHTDQPDDRHTAGGDAGGDHLPDHGGRPADHVPVGARQRGDREQRRRGHVGEADRRVLLVPHHREGQLVAQRQLHLHRLQRRRTGEVHRAPYRQR